MGFGAVLGQSRNAGSAPTTSTGKRTARFSIGTSTNGWTANDCDYLCDGTADDVEINAAIQALPSGGGEIVILDGTYNISATINISIDNVTLSGNGSNTVLVRQWSAPSGGNISTFPLIYCFSKCDIINLTINGNNYSSINNYGIYINLYKAKCKIEDCFLINNYCGIYVRGTSTQSSISTCYFYVINNYFTNNREDINAIFDVANGKILNNFFDRNLFDTVTRYFSIILNSGGSSSGLYKPHYIIISNNEFINGGIFSNCNYTIFSNNIFTEIEENAIQINGRYSDTRYYGFNNIIIGNIIIAKDAQTILGGIRLQDSSQYNLVTNNQLVNGATISNNGTNNIVDNNIITP